MVAHNIWDVEAQFKSDIFCQIKTLPATHKKLCIIGSSPILAAKQLNSQAGKAIIYFKRVLYIGSYHNGSEYGSDPQYESSTLSLPTTKKIMYGGKYNA